MPDMPAVFYVPAIGSLVSALGIVWALYLKTDKTLTDFLVHSAVESTKSVTLNSEALNNNTIALGSFAATAQALLEALNHGRDSRE